jgi:aminoglycoside phosphotransferase (APT) family kinase protein
LFGRDALRPAIQVPKWGDTLRVVFASAPLRDKEGKLGNVVATGSRSIIYEWGDGAVAKVPRRSTPDTWAKFEFDYTQAVHACGVRVPAPVGIASVDGRPAMVSDRVTGPSMWEALVANPSDAGRFGRQLGEIHLQLFATRPPITIPSQRSRLSSKIREAARSRDPRLLRALEVLPPQPTKPSLCHGDFHPKNIILSDAGPVIVDWFDVSRGDACGDVMRTLLLLSTPSDSPVSQGHLPGGSEEVLAELRSSYEQTMRTALLLESSAMQAWQIIEAAARLAENVDETPLRDALTEFLGTPE